jgi:Zn-dependent protease
MYLMVFTISELVQIGITVIAIGFIFSGYIKKPKLYDDVENFFGGGRFSHLFDWEDFKFSTMIVAPAIILHEFGHKFVGIALGYHSYFTAWPTGLGLGVVLRLIGSRFLLFAPGFVNITGNVPASEMAIIAFAGPLVNLILFAGSWAMLESGKFRKHARALHISKMINMWLFIFNMIPFGPLDGAKVLRGLLALI